MPRSHRRPIITAVGLPPVPWTYEQELARAQAAQTREPTTDARHVTGETPCRVCGALVAAEDAAYSGPWRQHRGCVTTGADPAQRLRQAARWLQVASLSYVEAQLVPFRVPLFEETTTETTSKPNRQPWQHVDRKALVRALAALPTLRVEYGLDPSTCTHGRCAWCGVEEARRWTLHGHRWADGSEAPLCRSCGEVYERHGEPSVESWADHREAISESVTGVPLPMGFSAPEGLLAYAEHPEGDGTAWSHLPPDAVESWRWWGWAKWPSQAPQAAREEAQRRAVEQQARQAARRAQEAADEAAKRDRHGFGTVV
jgi:hypothetical protein